MDYPIALAEAHNQAVVRGRESHPFLCSAGTGNDSRRTAQRGGGGGPPPLLTKEARKRGSIA